jgi:hypothetical protein
MTNFQTKEKALFQFPAVQLLINLGYEYLSLGEALKISARRVPSVPRRNGTP